MERRGDGAVARFYQEAAKDNQASKRSLGEAEGVTRVSLHSTQATLAAVAVKRVIAWQIEQEMTAQKLTKTSMEKKMHTSRRH